MKKIIIFILIMSSVANAEFKGDIEAGHGLKEFYNERVAFAKFHFSKSWKLWQIKPSVFGGWRTWMTVKGADGNPFREIYHIGGKVNYGGLYVKYYHLCNHAVYSPYNSTKKWFNETWGEDIDYISIGYEFTVK